MPLVLAIVHLAGNMVRDTILCRTDPGPFLFRHHTIGHCLSSILFISLRVSLWNGKEQASARAYLCRKNALGSQMTKKIWQDASP
jgi:hypothetical protein